MSELSVIVLSAGKSTRMKSDTPKVLHPVCGRPLGHWPLRAAETLAPANVVVVVGHQAERVEADLKSAFPAVKTALQAEQKGTGHAAQIGLSALDDVTGTVVILYGDVPLLRPESLRSLLEIRGDRPLSMLTFTPEDPTGYGRIVRGDDGAVRAIVEHKDATSDQRAITECNPGIYAADAGFLGSALDALRADNAQGELYLTDVVAAAVDRGGVATLEIPAEETLGVNDRVQLAEAAACLRGRIVARHLQGGVSMDAPETVDIDDTVTLAPDVTLRRGVVLRGETKLERGVVVDVGCVLTDSVVEAGTVLHPYSILESARVGPDCSVGPFARLRPDTVLRAGAKVGNFVETKKTTLGEGAKANHLAYVGDATVGARANIGAGTITCNYDGVGKHPTTIGEGSFIGSNSTLVAPVVIDDGAYVGAGSTVTRDVPKNALALGRARQEIKEGYADRIRRLAEAKKNKKSS